MEKFEQRKEEIIKEKFRSNSVGNSNKDKINPNINNIKKVKENSIIRNINNKNIINEEKIIFESPQSQRRNINKNILKNILLSPKIYNKRNKIMSPMYKSIYIKNNKLSMPSEFELKYSKDIMEKKLKNFFKDNFSNNSNNNILENKEQSCLSEGNNINDNIYSFREEDNSRLFKSSNDVTLPFIKKVVPIKNIISDKNKYKMKRKFLDKEINERETSLIKYLKLDKKINPSFIEKVTKANIGKLSQINKVCEHFFIHEEKNNILQNKIKNKIELKKIKRLEIYKKNLKNMSCELKNYKNICKSLINKKESLEEALKFFVKYEHKYKYK